MFEAKTCVIILVLNAHLPNVIIEAKSVVNRLCNDTMTPVYRSLLRSRQCPASEVCLRLLSG